jgi:hypothetical protein
MDYRTRDSNLANKTTTEGGLRDCFIPQPNRHTNSVWREGGVAGIWQGTSRRCGREAGEENKVGLEDTGVGRRTADMEQLQRCGSVAVVVEVAIAASDLGVLPPKGCHTG